MESLPHVAEHEAVMRGLVGGSQRAGRDMGEAAVGMALEPLAPTLRLHVTHQRGSRGDAGLQRPRPMSAVQGLWG